MEMDEAAAAGVALDVKVILTPPPEYFISDYLYRIYRGAAVLRANSLYGCRS
jgi:hypothetical protein